MRRLYDAYAEGGIEAALGYISPDCRLFPFAEGMMVTTELRGHDGLRSMEAPWVESFDEFEYGLNEIRDAGERVVFLGWLAGQVRDAGTPIRQTIAATLSEFSEGRVGEMRFFVSWKEALEAAGLSE